MTLDLANFEDQAREAVKLFWGNREAALARQVEAGNVDAGTRGAVTAGKNMDGFLVIAQSLIEANGLDEVYGIMAYSLMAYSIVLGHH